MNEFDISGLVKYIKYTIATEQENKRQEESDKFDEIGEYHEGWYDGIDEGLNAVLDRIVELSKVK